MSHILCMMRVHAPDTSTAKSSALDAFHSLSFDHTNFWKHITRDVNEEDFNRLKLLNEVSPSNSEYHKELSRVMDLDKEIEDEVEKWNQNSIIEWYYTTALFDTMVAEYIDANNTYKINMHVMYQIDSGFYDYLSKIENHLVLNSGNVWTGILSAEDVRSKEYNSIFKEAVSMCELYFDSDALDAISEEDILDIPTSGDIYYIIGNVHI